MSEQELNLKFVGEVEKHQELYNYNLIAYSRKGLVEKAWKEVAARMDMSATECKKKWRNIRTAFKRKMKPLRTRGGSKKQAYYLENALQFFLPFMNLPPEPTKLTCDIDMAVGNPEDSESLVDRSTPSPKQPTSPNSLAVPQQTYGRSSQFSSFKRKLALGNKSTTTKEPEHPIAEYFKSEMSSEAESSSETSDRPLQSLSKGNLTLENKSTSGKRDHSVAEYFKSEMSSLRANGAESSCQRIDRQEALKMFLLSLIPELEELTDSQIKKFKMRVLRMIAEIART